MSADVTAAMQPLLQRLARMEGEIAQVKRNQRMPQLGNASIDNGSLVVNDSDGNPALILGAQDDGTFAVVGTGDATPPSPSDPTLVPGIGEISASWDGLLTDGTTPLADFDNLQVHVSTDPNFNPDITTLQGVLHGPGTFRIGNLNNQTTYYVLFVLVNNAGNLSEFSNVVSAIPVYTAAVLTYAGTPGFDTLIASISAAGGVDQYANPYVNGVVAYGVGDNSYVQMRPGVTAEVRIGSGNTAEAVPAIVANSLINWGGGIVSLATVLQTPFVSGQTSYAQIQLGSASSDLVTPADIEIFVTDTVTGQSSQASFETDHVNIFVEAGGFSNGVQVALDGINNAILMGAGFGLGANTQAMYFDTINGAIVFSNPIFAATAPGGTTLSTWQSATMQNNWASSNLKFKLKATGEVRVLGTIDPASVTGGFPSTVFTLPTGFRPATTQDHTAGFHTATGAGQGVFFRSNTSGVVQAFNASTASGVLVVDFDIPLDY